MGGSACSPSGLHGQRRRHGHGNTAGRATGVAPGLDSFLLMPMAAASIFWRWGIVSSPATCPGDASTAKALVTSHGSVGGRGASTRSAGAMLVSGV